jgi:ribokinase
MYDLITIGGISIDFYFKGESLTYKDNRFQLAVGGKYLATEFHHSVGGGAANVAISAAKHNLKVAVLGMIGNNPYKYMIVEELANKGVSYELCPIIDNYFNLSTILLNPKGERCIINYITPHQHILDKNILSYLYHSRGIFLGNLPSVLFEERVNLLKNIKKTNINTFINLGISDCRRTKTQIYSLLQYSDVIFLNGHEFAELVKAPYDDIYFKENVIKHYLPDFINKIFIITEGAKGSFGYQNDLVLYQQAVNIEKIIDTTGAGDGFTGSFIAEYLKSKKISKALEKGSQYAAKILQKIGAN